MSASKTHRGFTLIEVLIAVLVLAIGLLGIGAVFPVVVRQQRQAQDTIQGLTARKNAESYMLARSPKKDLPGFISQVSKSGRSTTITCQGEHGLYVGDSIGFAIVNGASSDPNAIEYRRKEKIRELLDGREFVISSIPTPSSLVVSVNISEDELGLAIVKPNSTQDLWQWNLVRTSLVRDIAVLIAETSTQDAQEWTLPKVNLTTGLVTIDQEKIPMGERLSPPPFSESGDPQFVWDFGARLPELSRDSAGKVTKLGDLELVFFVRRVDTGITLGQPSGKKYSLSHVLAGDGVPANYRRVPVGVDNTGRATLNGTPNYSTVQVLNAEPRESGAKLQFPTSTPAGLLASLRQPGQKFVDNTGLVHTVAKADDVDRSTVVLEQPVPADVIERIENDGFQLRVLATPQVPAAVTVVKVSL